MTGAVAASGPGLADPWPRGKVTSCPFALASPFRGRGGAVTALRAVDLSFRGKVWGAHFMLQVSPASDVLSSPLMSVKITKRKLAFLRIR